MTDKQKLTADKINKPMPKSGGGWGNANGLADLSPKSLARAKSAAPVSAEPVGWLGVEAGNILVARRSKWINGCPDRLIALGGRTDDFILNTYVTPDDIADFEIMTATVAAQAQPCQRSCADWGMMEEDTQAQQPVSGADGVLLKEALSVILWLERRIPNIYKVNGKVGYGIQDFISKLDSALANQPSSGTDQFRDAAQMIEPSGNSGELPRLPLNDPAAAYRVLHDCGQSCARAALAQQDADKVNGALAEMVHAMFRSSNSIPVTRITIDRKQYEAAIDSARKEAGQ